MSVSSLYIFHFLSIITALGAFATYELLYYSNISMSITLAALTNIMWLYVGLVAHRSCSHYYNPLLVLYICILGHLGIFICTMTINIHYFVIGFYSAAIDSIWMTSIFYFH